MFLSSGFQRSSFPVPVLMYVLRKAAQACRWSMWQRPVSGSLFSPATKASRWRWAASNSRDQSMPARQLWGEYFLAPKARTSARPRLASTGIKLIGSFP